jgi:hypothetical protein
MLKMMIICFVLIIQCHFYDGKIFEIQQKMKSRIYFRALCAPGWIRKWHAAVRVTKTRKMVGFISAVPIKMKVYEK